MTHRAATDDDLLKFYGWLSEHLIPKATNGMGTYRELRAMLIAHIVG